MQPQEFDVDFGEVTRGEVSGVSSVNGKTGAVILTAEDLGADTSEQVDTKIATAKSEVEAEIPVVNNATLTIQKNSTTIDTFTANSSTNKTVNITVPTKTSDITNDSSYQTANEVQEAILVETNARIAADNALGQSVNAETAARQAADNNLQGQIDAITSSSDVVDVVGTYAELQEYDTTHLKDNDIVKVLVDETHNDAITYYRWTHSTTPYSWVYIGSQGPFYTKSEADALLNDKQDTLTAGEGISLVDNEIGVDFDVVATNTRVTEEQTRAEAAEQALGDAIPELLSSTGQSTTAGMTQKAITDALAGAGGVKELTSADYNWPTTGTPTSVALWLLDSGVYHAASNIVIRVNKGSESSSGSRLYIINKGASSSSMIIMPISSSDNNMTRVFTTISGDNDGGGSTYLVQSDVKNSLTSTSTNTPLSANQGKVLKDLIDSLIIKGTGAPTTSTVGTVGQLYEDTTNGALYQCTAVSGSTYTWEEVGGGGSGVQYSDLFADGSTQRKIKIGSGSQDSSTGFSVAIGYNAKVQANGGNGLAIGNSSSNSCSGGIALGGSTTTYGPTPDGIYNGQIAIGSVASTKYGGQISIGQGASIGTGTYSGAIALGSNSGSNITAAGMMDISTSITDRGYNNTNYRLLTGLHDPVSDHDAATKKYVDDHSGGGVNVVQTTGTSTTDVMSQDATTKLVWADYDSRNINIGGGAASGGYSITIGGGARSTQSRAVALGGGTLAQAANSTSLGSNANSSHSFSVSLGSYSSTSSAGEVSIGGSSLGTNGYNGTSYRKITNVYDGENAHDCATYGQIQALQDTIDALEARIAALEGNA